MSLINILVPISQHEKSGNLYYEHPLGLLTKMKI